MARARGTVCARPPARVYGVRAQRNTTTSTTNKNGDAQETEIRTNLDSSAALNYPAQNTSLELSTTR
eukprot:107544-Alexandrium_andersonii.AAC.1